MTALRSAASAPGRLLAILLGGLVVGGALGFTIAQSLRSDPTPLAAATPAAATTPVPVTASLPTFAPPASAKAPVAAEPAAAPADLDFAAEARRLLGLTPGAERDNAIADLLRRWIAQDAPAGLAWVRGLSLGDQRRQLPGAVAEWAKRDPRAALDFARALPVSQVRRRAEIEAVQAWAKSDAASALNYARAMPAGRERNDYARLMIASLATERPDLAAPLLNELPPSGSRNGTAAAIAKDYAQKIGFGPAFQWAFSLPDQGDRRAALSAVIDDGVINGDAAAALQSALSVPDAEMRGKLIAGSLGRLAADDPGGAVSLLSQLPVNEQNPEAWRGIIAAWANNDPPAAAEYTRTQLKGDNYEESIRAAMWAWSRQDVQAAAQWSLGLADSPARNAVWRQVAWSLLNSDQAAATTFINALPESAGRDQAVMALTRDLGRSNPLAAVQWAGSITDDRMRDFTTRGVFVQWFGVDPAAANAALQTANLTAEQKTAITNAVASGAGGRRFGGPGGRRSARKVAAGAPLGRRGYYFTTEAAQSGLPSLTAAGAMPATRWAPLTLNSSMMDSPALSVE